MPIIPLTCPACGANLTVDSNKDAAICQFCGKPYIVKDAIVQNYINNVTNINADTVNVYSQKDFDIKGGVLEHYNGESIDVVIPDNVKKIGNHAFEELMVRSVKLPTGVTHIGEKAFYQCTALENVTIPDSVTFIGGAAFTGCAALTSIVIPDSVTRIDTFLHRSGTGYVVSKIGAFSGCSSLRNIKLGSGLTFIGEAMFQGCTDLGSIAIPDSVAKIGDNAFRGCGLTSVTISDRVTEIGESAFSDCTKLKSVKIGKGLTRISKRAFEGCSSLMSLTLGSNVTSIDYEAFHSCTGLTSVTIPNSVTRMEVHSFENCSNLGNVVFQTAAADRNRQFSAWNATDYDLQSHYGNSPSVLYRCFYGTPWGNRKLEEERQAVEADRRRRGVCLYCGGTFVGFFNQKCTKCGKPRNY